MACRGLAVPGATASLYAPLPNSNIEQWHMVDIVTGYTLFATSKYNWRNMHIILHALSLHVVVQCVTAMNMHYQRSKLGDRSKS